MRLWICGLVCAVPLLMAGCGHKLGYRHYAGPILPAVDRVDSAQYVIHDDQSLYLR